MERQSQCYLGVRNAVIFCADHQDHCLQGRLYCSYHRGAMAVKDEMDLLLQMEGLFDDLGFPFPGNNERHFVKRSSIMPKKKELEKVTEDEEILDMHGDLGTFIIRVQHRQNSSWQGRITWVEKNKTVYFRSVWEMMKLIEEALADQKSAEETDSPHFIDEN